MNMLLYTIYSQVLQLWSFNALYPYPNVLRKVFLKTDKIAIP